ncbi:MAG: XdhC family protein, partial [Planctomycetes bacterium]|nr:XdhC family protein [Planctomycetota bacterium]
AARAIQEGAPRLSIHVLTEKEAAKTGLICGGKVEVFIEPLVSHRVYIFGGGHVGREVEALARRVGFSTTVIDDREEFASRARFPEAGDVRRLDFAAWPEHVVIGPNAYIVILTRGHEHDEIVLAGALKTPARYIGMIGSARKVKRTYDRMLKKGDEKVTEAALARVEAPIGIDIGSRTSEEIAVSIVARLIQVKNEGKG